MSLAPPVRYEAQDRNDAVEAVYSFLIHSRNRRGKRSGQLGSLNAITILHSPTLAFTIIKTLIFHHNLCI